MATGYLSDRHTLPEKARRSVKGNAGPSGKFTPWQQTKRILAIIGVALLCCAAGLMLYFAVLVRSIANHLPTVSSLDMTTLNPVTTVVSSDGVVLASFESKYRRPEPLASISQNLIDATVATEDARFYRHHGIDFRGALRAVFFNLKNGNATGQGGSTITQQLARNLYLSNEKTLDRKIEEALLSRRIEEQYSKQEILEAYLNTIYYGNGCYGAEAASRAYFNKSAADLTLGEAALLAGVPQRPTAYSPVQHLDAALRRRIDVLYRMRMTHKITEAQRLSALKEIPHVFRPHLQSQRDWKAPYFVARTLAILREQYGPEFLYSGATVVTTLNWQIQQAAEHALRAGLHTSRANTGAVVSLDPRNGAVRALVGGPDFAKDQFDAAVQGIRQPGSAFKPIVYAAAFDMNVVNLANTLDDKQLIYPQSRKPWIVHNYDDHYRGNVTLLEALRELLNSVAVQVAEHTGPDAIVSYGQRFGITTPLQADLPLALGASGVHPIDLCSAYTTFANKGQRYTPYFILNIKDAGGAETFRDDPIKRLHPTFLNPNTLDQINVALREVVLHGTGMAAAVIPDAHGKTGTTSSHRDAWFSGYTSNLVTTIWLARVHKEITRKGKAQTTEVTYETMPGGTGGGLCAPMWARFMASALPVQNRVDQAHGIVDEPISQPQKDSFMASLHEQAGETGLGQEASARFAQRAAQNAAPVARPAPDAYPESYAPGNAGAENDRSDRPGQPVPDNSGFRSDREERRIEDDASMEHDIDQGYREFESNKHKDRL